MSKFSHEQIEAVEAEIARWQTFVNLPEWKLISADARVTINTWRNGLEEETGEMLLRGQGMIKGARMVLALAESRISEAQLKLENMLEYNREKEAEMEYETE